MGEKTEDALPKNLGYNLQRLMADQGLTVEQVAEGSGLDKRTVMGILHGRKKAQPRTIGRLARGLGVATSELLRQPAQLEYRSRFDRDTNPLVDQAMEAHPTVFAGWTDSDYDELHSRMGTGGPLTAEGALEAARQMNVKRGLHEKLTVLLESSQADVIAGIVELMYGKAVEEEEHD